MLNFFFGFRGRVRRSSYFFGVLVACAVWSVLGATSLAAGSMDLDLSFDTVMLDYDPSPLAIAISAVVGVLALWSCAALTVKRWHDVGVTGWFALLGLPPFANFIVFVLLCLLPGTPGANRYGESPRQDDLLAVA